MSHSTNSNNSLLLTSEVRCIRTARCSLKVVVPCVVGICTIRFSIFVSQCTYSCLHFQNLHLYNSPQFNPRTQHAFAQEQELTTTATVHHCFAVAPTPGSNCSYPPANGQRNVTKQIGRPGATVCGGERDARHLPGGSLEGEPAGSKRPTASLFRTKIFWYGKLR